MRKLKEIKIKIDYVPRENYDDGMFDDNICPTCGHNIKNIIPNHRSKEGFFKTLYYRYADLVCPECGTKFTKRIDDKYELNDKRTIIAGTCISTAIGCFILCAIYILFSLFDTFFVHYLIQSSIVGLITFVAGLSILPKDPHCY